MPFNSKTGSDAGKKSKREKSKEIEELRDALYRLTVMNIDKYSEWFNQIADKDPAKALDLNIKLLSYVMPKMKPIEVDVENEQQMPNKITVIRASDITKS